MKENNKEKTGKSLSEYTDRELLKHLAELVRDYDGMRDEEWEIMEEQPCKDMWDKETEKQYQGLLGDIITKWNEIRKILDFADNLK